MKLDKVLYSAIRNLDRTSGIDERYEDMWQSLLPLLGGLALMIVLNALWSLLLLLRPRLYPSQKNWADQRPFLMFLGIYLLGGTVALLAKYSMEHPQDALSHNVVEGLGWYGIVAILLAYFLAHLKKLEPGNLLYMFLNVSGAIQLAAVSITKGAWQPAALNFAWVIIPLATFLQGLWIKLPDLPKAR